MVVLGLVSLLTDLSSEMIYPLLPVFLTAVLGAGPVALGLVEGVAEATSSMLKIVSGRATDRSGRRKPLVVAGYSISGVARPLIGLATAWPFVLFCRFADRIGKGLRSSPRDAMIADATPAGQRGAAFGLHRSMDHAGAVLGPLAAAGLLALGFGYRGVFLCAFVPALAVVALLILGTRETGRGRSAPAVPEAVSEPRASSAAASAVTPTSRAATPRGWPRLLAGAFLATLGTPADAFLLLLLSSAGIAPAKVALLWSAHNVIRSGATLAAGRLADRLPRLRLVAAGWIVRAGVLAALGLAATATAIAAAGGGAEANAGSPAALAGLVAVFIVYGAAAALTEPAERALVADLVKRDARGRAYGLYHAAAGFGALPASALFGWSWSRVGTPVTFAAAATVLAVASAVVLWPSRRVASAEN